MTGYRLVMIEWADAYGVSADWVPLPIAAHEHRIHSVGWLVAESDAAVCLVPHLSLGGQASDSPAAACGDMVVPRSAIRSMVELRSE